MLPGGLGFIGRNFLLRRPTHWQVVSLDIVEDKTFQKKIKNAQFIRVDLADNNQVEKISQKFKQKFDICLFLAANGDPAYSVTNPREDIFATTFSFINVLEAFRIKKLLYFSSGAVYEGYRGQVLVKILPSPTLPYAITHLACEEYAKFYQQSKRISSYLIFRFFGAYGPYEPERKIYTKLVKAFAFKKTKEFVIRGNGQNQIDAMFVDDAVDGIIKAIKSAKTNLTVDFCAGKHLTINQLVKTSAAVFNQKVSIRHQGEVPEYNRFYALSREFEQLFNFKPKISMEEGLRRLKEHLIRQKQF